MTRRYLRVLWPALVALTMALFASILADQAGHRLGAAAGVVAVLPCAADRALMMMGAGLRYLRIDEPRRRDGTGTIGIAKPTGWRCCISPAACCEGEGGRPGCPRCDDLGFPAAVRRLRRIAKMVLARRYL